MSNSINPFKIEFHKKSSKFFGGTYHAHAEMEILYIHQGEGTLIINQQTHNISPGSLMVFQPFQLHRIQIPDLTNSPFVRSLISFNPTSLEEHLRVYPALFTFLRHLTRDQLKTHLVNIDENDELIKLMELFYRLEGNLNHTTDYEASLQFLALFLRYFMPKWKTYEDNISWLPPRNPQRVEIILQWLELHFHEPFRLENLAKELYLSPHRISHLFKEATGTSITQYVTSRRIHEACLLLNSTELSVREIGEKVGYTNCSHFCKMFKRVMGMTPYQFSRLQNDHNNL
ncbi:MAG: AraC family transcriptional regulator [Epulopiscium sp.]|nr:AraC family transcriptional regulator [Candidatus Epulonipiscium sp.]